MSEQQNTGAGAPAPGGEADQSRSVDERLAAQDAKIDGLGSKIDKLAAALTGSSLPKGQDGTANGGGNSPPPLSVAEQVRQGVKEIEAEKARKAAAASKTEADTAWRQSVEERLAEKPPAEPASGRKARLQRFLIGKPDQ